MENLNNKNINQINETMAKSSSKLKNIVDWITEESTKLGYNFSTLPRNKQNQIIEHIMSGLENGFRSRCNYPDLRFAKRRGIGRNNYSGSSGTNAMGNDMPPQCTNPIPDACGVPPGDVCDSNGCGGGGVIDVDNCSENDGFTCDNGCVNESTASCTDSEKCLDNECTNTTTCSDENTGCIDNACQNQTCADTHMCSDDECANTTECSDSGGALMIETCIDTYCENSATPEESGGCTDSLPACRDNSCHNDRFCEDSGTVTLLCIDNSCINSGNGISIPGREAGCIDRIAEIGHA